MEQIAAFGQELWWVLGEAGLWLLFGFACSGVLHAWVPTSLLQRQIGKPGLGSVIKSTLVGIPLPLCSCSVIPMASTLRASGASKGASAAFAVSTPEIDVPAVSLTWALLGWPLALARVAGAAISAIVAGILIDVFGSPGRGPRTVEVRSCCQSAVTPAPACCSSAPPKAPGFAERLREALLYAFLGLPKELAPWLTLGLALTALVGVLIPDGWLGEVVGSGAGAMLLALVIGVPVYVCATSSTPLAAALVVGGLSPGAALVFLLAGPATNPATVAWAWKDLGARSTLLYLLSIGAVALAFGFGFEWLLAGGSAGSSGAGAHHHAMGVGATIGAVGLGVLLAVGLWRFVAGRLVSWRPATGRPTPGSVSGCDHCS